MMQPTGEVRITRSLWARLSEVLLSDRTVETKCFMLCRVLELPARTVFLVRELIEVPPEGYEERSASRVVTRREFVHELLVRCASEGLSLLEAHSHPWTPNPRFSSVDHQSDYQKFLATQSLSPPFRHGSLVFGSDMSFDGHMWDYVNQQVVPIERLCIVGAPYEVRYVVGSVPPELDKAQQELYDRQVRALGVEGQAVLGTLCVALVGAGGLGSQIAQALTLLGVGQILLIDPDRLELSNLNRVVGATWSRACRRWRKVKALAQSLNRARPPESPAVVPAAYDARLPGLLPPILSCDLIIGAVDSATVRQYLNMVAACALMPYLDAGVGIRAEAGRIVQGGGQVQVVLPGETACLTCIGHLVRQSVEEQLTPEQREMSIRHGYIQGEHIPNPQVVFLNGVVANLLVWEFVKLCTGCLPVQPYVYYDLVGQQAFPAHAERNPDCFICSERAGSLLATGLEGVSSFLTPSHYNPPPAPRPRSQSNPPDPSDRGGLR
ncbi:MAG: ThiF family adenylyltransferase [Fimbriimonadales bacterium]|nr:ThiF family adenylyltransferase [Fimbriimonadales bacterium]